MAREALMSLAHAHRSAAPARRPATRRGSRAREDDLLELVSEIGNARVNRVLDGATIGRARAVHPAVAALLQRQSAPVDQDRGTTTRLELDPDFVRAGIDFVRGRHRFGGQTAIEDPLHIPLDLLGNPIPGLDPARLTALIYYSGRCNQAFQSALLSFESSPFVTGPVPWQLGARVNLRIGRFVVGPSATLDFEGSDPARVAVFLRIASAQSTEIPIECFPPTHPHDPEIPDEPHVPETHRDPPVRTDKPPVASRELPRFTVHFFYDSTILREEENLRTIDWVRTLMAIVPSLEVQVRGHASLEGSDRYNLRLSRRRAEAVKDLVTLGGVAASRVHTQGLGEWAPEAAEPFDAQERRSDLMPQSRLEQARMLNRRVELILFDPSGVYEPTLPPVQLSSHPVKAR